MNTEMSIPPSGAVDTTLSPTLPKEYLGAPRPLTQGELDKMLPELSKLVMDKLPAINEKMRLAQEEARRLREQVQEVDNSIQAKENRLQDLQSTANSLRAKEQELRANAQKLHQEANQERRELITKRFYSIFIFDNKKPLSTEQINQLFDTYLADGFLSLHGTENGDPYNKLSSMKPVISYLAEHPDINIKGCDFRFLKTHVGDIPTLAEFLKKSTVKAIAINSGIPAEAKASLSEAIAARNGGLKVQYYA